MPLTQFNNALEGWTTSNNTEVYVASGGNPGGHIQGSEGGTGVWYFNGPSAFTGNLSNFYNGVLSFDMQQLKTTSQFDQEEVRITGSNGVTIYADNFANPGINWQSFSYSMALGGGWKVLSTTNVATEAEIRSVLQDVASFQIRGEFVNGSPQDTSFLDNVSLALPTGNGGNTGVFADRIESRFDTDTDGWSFLEDVSEFRWIGNGGNPGGYLSAVDAAAGDVWYFVAPSKFLGDQSAFYGGTISYDLEQSSTSSQFNAADLVLRGGGLVIVADQALNPETDWTSFSIKLDERGDWRLDALGGTNASQSQIQQVLNNLTSVEVRGEFRTGPDTGGLDNFVMSKGSDVLVYEAASAPFTNLSFTATNFSNAMALGFDGSSIDIFGPSPAIGDAPFSVTLNNLIVRTPDDWNAKFNLQQAGSFSLVGNGSFEVQGTGGNDFLRGAGGNDKLFGNDGNDALLGGSGDDELFGWVGDDELFGDDGADRLFGQGGNDSLFGWSGNDQLEGDDGNDRLFGQGDNDTLFGWVGEDQLFGDDGNDTLFGQQDADLLLGWEGDDTLYGGSGNDIMDGQGGADTYIFDLADMNAGGLDIILSYDAADTYLIKGNPGQNISYHTFNGSASIDVNLAGGGTFVIDVVGSTEAQLINQVQFF